MSAQYHTLSAGLDVPSRNELHELMRELQTSGTTMILATHDMAEAEKMTDRVAILLHGIIVATGTPRELTATGSGLTKVSVRTEGSSLSKSNLTFPAVNQQALVDEYAIYYSTGPGPAVSAIIAHIQAQGDTLIDLRVERPSLEERFLEITGTGARSVKHLGSGILTLDFGDILQESLKKYAGVIDKNTA